MKYDQNERFVRAILRSARSDGPPPGARGRTLARLQEEMGGAWGGSREVASALTAVLIMAIVGLGMFGRASAEASRPAVSPAPCVAGIESTASACSEVSGAEVGSSSGSLSSSSGGLSGSSSSSG